MLLIVVGTVRRVLLLMVINREGGGGRGAGEDIPCDKLEEAVVVLSTGKLVQVKHTGASTKRPEQRLYGLPSRSYHSIY